MRVPWATLGSQASDQINQSIFPHIKKFSVDIEIKRRRLALSHTQVLTSLEEYLRGVKKKNYLFWEHEFNS